MSVVVVFATIMKAIRKMKIPSIRIGLDFLIISGVCNDIYIESITSGTLFPFLVIVLDTNSAIRIIVPPVNSMIDMNLRFELLAMESIPSENAIPENIKEITPNPIKNKLAILPAVCLVFGKAMTPIAINKSPMKTNQKLKTDEAKSLSLITSNVENGTNQNNKNNENIVTVPKGSILFNFLKGLLDSLTFTI